MAPYLVSHKIRLAKRIIDSYTACGCGLARRHLVFCFVLWICHNLVRKRPWSTEEKEAVDIMLYGIDCWWYAADCWNGTDCWCSFAKDFATVAVDIMLYGADCWNGTDCWSSFAKDFATVAVDIMLYRTDCWNGTDCWSSCSERFATVAITTGSWLFTLSCWTFIASFTSRADWCLLYRYTTSTSQNSHRTVTGHTQLRCDVILVENIYLEILRKFPQFFQCIFWNCDLDYR